MSKRGKHESQGTVAVDSPIQRFGRIRRKFIMEHIRAIHYEDLAKLIGVDPEELREAVEQMGVKLPIERAVRWEEIEFEMNVPLEICARCKVQINHRAFHVEMSGCRECYEKNITLWIDRGEPITVKFPNE